MKLPERFLDEMKEIVPDYEAFLRSYELPPAKAMRINAAKTDDATLLAAMGARDKVPFADHCYYLGSDEKWGAHPFHHAGLMYIQEPSAMAAISAYDIKAELAIDLCAAPGGKTIQLSSKVKSLVSNEINPARASVLKGNIERMGLKNVAVTNHSPKELECLGEIFDLVLADVPCSGEGMFRKDDGAVREWSEEHSVSCAVRQLAILHSADKLLKKGGTLIYSTCTFSRRENEDVLKKFMEDRPYELIMPLPEIIGCTTYLTDERMRRFYPHIASGEGQFFAALVKTDGSYGKLPSANKRARSKEVSAFLSDTLGREMNYCVHDDIFYLPALPFDIPLSRVATGGVRIGRLAGKVIRPDHAFFSAYGREMFGYEPSEAELKKYLHGEELSGDHSGYGAITVLGAPLGGFKGSNGRYKNLYPKGIRI